MHSIYHGATVKSLQERGGMGVKLETKRRLSASFVRPYQVIEIFEVHMNFRPGAISAFPLEVHF